MRFVRINAGEDWCQDKVGVIVENPRGREAWMSHYDLEVCLRGHPLNPDWELDVYGFQWREVIPMF
jgi:hypothetical protein